MFRPKKTDYSQKIPVTILTGFLGSGKTTLLNRLLQHLVGKKVSVIMNEYGEVGIDGQLLYQTDEQLVEFNNGCLCCTVRQDLIRLLDKMTEIETPEYVLIETTGLADPAPVASTFFVNPSIQDKYYIDSFITIVDAVNVERNLEDSHEALEQITFADIIIINKVDLLQNKDKLNEIETKMKQLNPLAKIYQVSNCELDPEQLLDTQGFNLNVKLEVDPTFLEDTAHVHDQSVGSMVIRFNGEIDLGYFQNWMNQELLANGENIYRSKGILCARGFKNKVIYQSVRMLNTLQFEDEWKEDEERISEFVIIGRNLDKKYYEDNILRFVRPKKNR